MRCFVALVPPRSLADRVAGWGEGALASLESVRALPAASLHVTLAFLGELESVDVERAGEIVSAVEPRCIRFRLEPEVVGVPRRRPRVLALNDGSGEIEALQAEVVEGLSGAGLFEPESRPFWPHLSFARVKRGTLDGKRGRAALDRIPRLSGPALEPQAAERLVLYRSELGSGGARYTALTAVALPGEEAT